MPVAPSTTVTEGPRTSGPGMGAAVVDGMGDSTTTLVWNGSTKSDQKLEAHENLIVTFPTDAAAAFSKNAPPNPTLIAITMSPSRFTFGVSGDTN